MNYINTLDELSSSFAAKEHTKALGNVEECKMFLHIHPSAEILLVTKGELTVHILGKPDEAIPEGHAALLFPFQSIDQRVDTVEIFPTFSVRRDRLVFKNVQILKFHVILR